MRQAAKVACFLANVNSLPFDYVVRQKVAGTTLNFFIVKQFPVLPPFAYNPADTAFIAPARPGTGLHRLGHGAVRGRPVG